MMYKFKILACSLLFLAVLVPFPLVAADVKEVLTHAKIMTLVESGLPSMEDERLDVVAASRRLAAAWTQLLPEFSLTTGASTKASAIAGTLSANASVALNVVLTLNSLGVLNEAKLESNYRLAQLAYTQAVALLTSQASQTYWSLAAFQANIAAYQRAVDQALLQFDVVNAQYQAGLIPELDLVRSQLSIEDAKTNLQAQRDVFVDSLAVFKADIGLSDPEQSPMLETISYTPLELPAAQELITLYLEQRLDIQLARLAAETTMLNADIMKRQAYSPTVTLSSSWDIGLSSSLVLSDSASFAVSMKIPLDGYFTSSNTSLSLLEAQEAATISSLSVQEKLSQAALEIESQSTNLRRIQDRVQVAEGTLALTQRAASLSHAAYDAGLIAYTELFESQGAVLTAEETLIQLKLSHITTLHNLAYALGLDAQSLTELYQQPHIL